MYFISEVMQEIWKPVSEEYKKYYDNAMSMEPERIFYLLKDIEMTTIEYPPPYPSLNLLATSGCPHAIKGGNFSGCSMCNHNVSDMAEYYAMINSLRNRNVDLYAKLVRRSFENKRGVIREKLSTEIVTGCDCLNDLEFPEQVYKELFGEEGTFQVRPFRYSFEVRADSVTESKLDSLYRYIRKGRAFFEIGVEVHDEWIRNHWLNKGVTNRQIKDAILRIKKKGGKINANVLIGIPGLTEKQSIDIFLDTVVWLNSLEVDRITFFPLNRKEYTLNGFLYNKLPENENLKKIGISQSSHTGLPWLFTVTKAIVEVFRIIPELKQCFGIAQYNIFDGSDILPYNADRLCKCNRLLFQVIDNLLKTLEIDELMNTFEKMCDDPCYGEYQKLLDLQEKAGDIRNTVLNVGEELSKIIWPQNWEKKLQGFQTELTELSKNQGEKEFQI